MFMLWQMEWLDSEDDASFLYFFVSPRYEMCALAEPFCTVILRWAIARKPSNSYFNCLCDFYFACEIRVSVTRNVNVGATDSIVADAPIDFNSWLFTLQRMA